MGPFDAIAFAALCVGLVKILNGPLARAVADRLRGRRAPETDSAWLADVDALGERVRQLEQMQSRMAELEERVDFAERLLSQPSHAARLGVTGKGNDR
ncbi:MAG TPA: hypothetical protein VFI77_03505 [Gemmatimonadales bacterium]|nr:hypothetical protein [Gemmatimonadales bacterium]